MPHMQHSSCVHERPFTNAPSIVDQTLKTEAFMSVILDEIFENAMVIATAKSTNLTNEASRRSCIRTYKDDTSFLQGRLNAMASNASDDANVPDASNIREMVEGICMNTRMTMNVEEPIRIDVETKRMVTEIMSSAYETTSRNNGVGDQSSDVNESAEQFDDDDVDDNARVVEKKSRVTDLVMNSKQVITQILLNEEERKKQEEWEEAQENVIQVINLDCVEPGDMAKLMAKIKLTNDTDDADEDDAADEEAFAPMPKDDTLELIDLTVDAYKEKETKTADVKEDHHGGKGDEFKNVREEELAPRSSKSLPSSSVQSRHQLQKAEEQENGEETKKEKRKRWNVGKIWAFFKRHTGKRMDGKNEAVENE